MSRILFFLLFAERIAQAQWFAGGTAGIATLTGDGRTIIDSTRTQIALYKPSNGPAFQVFAGRHLYDYLSIQAAYGWNRNPLTFTGTSLTGTQEDTFEQDRRSTQNSFGFDGMIYGRPRSSKWRPYVAGGAGLIHLNSRAQTLLISKGRPILPPDTFSATKPYWRTAVGIDFKLHPKWHFRFTFWETVTANPLSAQLRPPGKALFLNFLNNFGFVREF